MSSDAESNSSDEEFQSQRTRSGIGLSQPFLRASQSPADLPQKLKEVTYFVSEREFRMDVSSTAIRAATLESGSN